VLGGLRNCVTPVKGTAGLENLRRVNHLKYVSELSNTITSLKRKQESCSHRTVKKFIMCFTWTMEDPYDNHVHCAENRPKKNKEWSVA
jgi:hypothetical protein